MAGTTYTHRVNSETVWHVGIAQYRGQQSNTQVAQVCTSKAGYSETSGMAWQQHQALSSLLQSLEQQAALGSVEQAWRSRGAGSSSLTCLLSKRQHLQSASWSPLQEGAMVEATHTISAASCSCTSHSWPRCRRQNEQEQKHILLCTVIRG